MAARNRLHFRSIMPFPAIRPHRPSVTDVAALLVPLVVYALSLSSLPQAWDYAEMQTVPYILGIPHATGFPAFVIAGWLFTHVVPFGTVAWRMNAFCALCIAGSALLTKRLAVAFGANELPALAAAFVFAFSAVAWTKAANTDVHGLALLLSLATFNYAMAFARDRAWRTLAGAATCFGLGLAVHPNVLWSGLALVPGFVTVARKSRRRALALLAVAALPLLLYAYLPIRSAIVEYAGLDPAAAQPFAYRGEIDWDTNRPSTLAGFVVEVSGSEFHAGNSLLSVLDVPRYPTLVSLWVQNVASQLGTITVVLAAVGLLALARRRGNDSVCSLWVVAAAVAAIPFAYSYPAETDLSRYVLASLAVTAALAANANLVTSRYRLVSASVLAIALAFVGASNYVRNAGQYAWKNGQGSQPIIDAVHASVPDGAVLVSNWIDGTGLAYAAFVDRSMGNRVLLLWRSADAGAYVQWAGDRRVFIVTDFAILDEVRRLVPSDHLVERPLIGADGDHHLFEVTRSPTATAR